MKRAIARSAPQSRAKPRAAQSSLRVQEGSLGAQTSGSDPRASRDAPYEGLHHAEARIREIGSKLRIRIAEASVSYRAEVGGIVVEHLHGGNLEVWRRRNKKDPSLRKLASQLRDVINARALYASLCVYEMRQRHASNPYVRTLGVRALVAISSASIDEQRELLARAEQQRFTAKQLEALVRLLPKRSRGGRRARPLIVKALNSALRALAQADEGSFARATESEAATITHSMELLAQVAVQVDRIRAELDRASSSPPPVPHVEQTTDSNPPRRQATTKKEGTFHEACLVPAADGSDLSCSGGSAGEGGSSGFEKKRTRIQTELTDSTVRAGPRARTSRVRTSGQDRTVSRS